MFRTTTNYHHSRFLIALIIALVVGASVTQAAHAQSIQPSASPLESPTSSSKQVDEMQKLKDQYKVELSVYRTDERNYTLAKEQFAQLGTLVSLEEAVKSTRTVMLSRSTVLLTYVRMIKIVGKEATGITAEEREDILSGLTDVETRLQKHQEIVRQAIDRKLIQAAVIDYNSFETKVPSAVYKTLSYTAYGHMKVVYDKTVILRDQVKQQIEDQEKNGLKLGEKRRAFVEIDKSLEETNRQLVEIHKHLTDTGPSTSGSSNGSSLYGQTVGSLGQVYADLFRTIGFLREVLKS